eukprot:scaffold4536_cov113-Isochrysis_galbana.AAC.11
MSSTMTTHCRPTPAPSRGLCGEGREHRVDTLLRGGHELVQEALHEHRFARASLAHEHHVRALCDEHAQHVLVTSRLASRHENVEERRTFDVLEGRIELHEQARATDEGVEFGARLFAQVATDGPDHREDEPETGQLVLVRVGLPFGADALFGHKGCLEHPEEAHDQVGIAGVGTRTQLRADKFESRLQVLVAQCEDPRLHVGQQLRQLVFAPRGDVRLVPNVNRLHEDHAAARHGGGRGYGKVVHLEDHVHRWRQLDPLAVGETQHLVVVEHGVHVLNPERIDRAVKGDPMEVVRVVPDGEAH